MAPINQTSLQSLRTLRSTDPLLDQTWPSSSEESKEEEECNTTSSGYNQHVKFDDEGNITTLNLGGRRLRKLSPENLISIFQPLDKLTTLNLGMSDLAPPLLFQVLSSLPKSSSSSSLQHLHLSGNNFRNDGMEKLAPILVSLEKELKVLDLRYNDIGSDGISYLCSFLNKSKALKILHLEGNEIKDEGASILATSLSSDSCYCCLEELYLGSNTIGPKGASSLASSLTQNKTLKKLHLEGNSIGPEGADAFSSVLEEMDGKKATKTLEKLYVDNNGMGKESAGRLAKALKSESTIGDIMG